MASNRISPNQREVLSAVSTVTNKQEYLSSTNNILNVNATVSVAGVATAANQTNGTQKTQLVDGSGNVIASTANALNVAVTSGGGGSVTQGTSPWIVAGGGTAGSAATGVVTIQGVASMTKLLVTPDSVALPANQSTNESQINGVTPLMGNGVTGTGSQRVTIASDNTAFSVNAVQSGTWNIGSITTLPTLANVTTVATVTTLTGTTTLTPGTGATNLGKAEDAASTTGDTGVFVLGVRNDTLAIATTNTNGDYAQFSTDTSGRTMTANAPRALKVNQQTTITASTAETTVLTSVASTFLDVYGCIVANTSASACDVIFKDATAGTTRFDIEVPAGETRGFMLPIDAAIPQAAVTNNWTATCGTSLTSIKITMLAVKMLG